MEPSGNTDTPTHDAAQRLDIWLYRTRLLKTRALATRLIQGGKLRLTRNGETLRTRKAHIRIRSGDELTFMRGSTLVNVIISSVAERRGPAAEARTHYVWIEDTAAPDASTPL